MREEQIRNLVSYVNKKPETIEEVILLYKSVGWTRYTDSPEQLMNAIHNSTYVISAYTNKKLIALIRGLSDDVSIHFIQDILVHPEYQKMGIGRNLTKKALALYPGVHKHLLLTDDEEYQKLFYGSLGLQNLNFIQPKLNAYIKVE